MRRPIRLVPYAASAISARRMALLGACLALGAIALARRGVAPGWTLPLLGLGLAFAVGAVAAALAAVVAIWRTGDKGAGRAVIGAILAGLTLAYPVYLLAILGIDMPAVDLTTDKQHPPAFNPPESMAEGFAPDLAWLMGRPAAQQGSDLEPVLLDLDAAAAFRASLKTATQLHWRITGTVAPSKRMPMGQIEAVALSTVMHLPERIAIRIVETRGQSRIDLRALNRTPYTLIGRDLRRNIQSFADALENQEPES